MRRRLDCGSRIAWNAAVGDHVDATMKSNRHKLAVGDTQPVLRSTLLETDDALGSSLFRDVPISRL